MRSSGPSHRWRSQRSWLAAMVSMGTLARVALPVQPVTFYVSSSSTEPMEVRVSHSGLRMMLVNRESVGLLDDSWTVLGVYFLLGPSEDNPDRYRAYVGEVGKRTLLLRVKEHVDSKQWWSRALLIASASDEFNSAEIGWLEGRLYDVLNNAVAAEVINKGRPGDNSLATQDRGVLERYVEPIMAALRACGASPDTADQRPPPKGKKKKVYEKSVKDLIDAGLLKAGTMLAPLRKGLTQTALVLPDGNLKIGEQVFTAVSPAARAVSGNKSEPGWDFWGAPSGEGGYVPLFELRDRLRDGDGTATGGSGSSSASIPLATTSAEPPPTAFVENPAEPPAILGTEPSDGKKPQQFSEKVTDFLDAGFLHPGDECRSVRRALSDARATLRPDGRLDINGEVHGSLSAAAVAVSGNKAEPGWEFWAVERDGKLVSLYELREKLRQSRSEMEP
ncbi:MAG: hypothetical protein LC808_07050 [Actinobacteria bacterium]|nr:hypothetical protein [Actinomycetota bacterium]